MSVITPVRRQLIELLADGEFHSGERLGNLLGISRAAINNHIGQLRKVGLDIFCVRGKGYCLHSPLELYQTERMRELAPGAPLHCFPVIDSTNLFLLDRVQELEKGEACVAECQVAGRARRGRSWVSPFGRQLILSLYWRLEQGMGAAMGLSLVIGCSVVEALKEQGIEGVGLKWPNDLYYQGRKLAGILVELKSTAGEACHVVSGIGLNLQLSASGEPQIDQPWSELAEAVSYPLDRNLLTAVILNKLRADLELFERDGMSAFYERWNRFDCFHDQPVRLLLGDRQIEGVARGIDPQGALLVDTAKGLEKFMGGEISLRPR
ncbi:bifunctional biotin--[acetyl-CoA-carboxylase] ligase/biotin operon repressor BirA [Dongshaea marina]|uniref:bifunctional biotin--[acetyl-CoA-carboxylase] ligase/biotin operon repressor BirA n=1 Tax=Dongshaea marina TaxID=2047966 RepID=UPI000D3ED873|nr:bifunctional biotin--[acetyl-CoA-carboxylase] ligase/biotin operon repressor BirA [Dongshaea marina]